MQSYKKGLLAGAACVSVALLVVLCVYASSRTWYRDLDQDGYGSQGSGTHFQFSQPDGYVAVDGDCNDGNPSTYPGAPESCDNEDDNCDGVVDEGFTPRLWYRDRDHDSYGTPLSSVMECACPPGFVSNSDDCDDRAGWIKPKATEVCLNKKDDDCDGTVDEPLCSP